MSFDVVSFPLTFLLQHFSMNERRESRPRWSSNRQPSKAIHDYFHHLKQEDQYPPGVEPEAPSFHYTIHEGVYHVTARFYYPRLNHLYRDEHVGSTLVDAREGAYGKICTTLRLPCSYKGTVFYEDPRPRQSRQHEFRDVDYGIYHVNAPGPIWQDDGFSDSGAGSDILAEEVRPPSEGSPAVSPAPAAPASPAPSVQEIALEQVRPPAEQSPGPSQWTPVALTIEDYLHKYHINPHHKTYQYMLDFLCREHRYTRKYYSLSDLGNMKNVKVVVAEGRVDLGTHQVNLGTSFVGLGGTILAAKERAALEACNHIIAKRNFPADQIIPQYLERDRHQRGVMRLGRRHYRSGPYHGYLRHQPVATQSQNSLSTYPLPGPWPPEPEGDY